MKRFLSFIGLLVFVATSSLGQTNVSGGILSPNTIWTKQGSPYILNGNILISSGNTLTIEDGVTVRVNGNFYIKVEGTLLAVGSSNSKIIFESNLSNPSKNSWVGIQIRPTSSTVISSELNYLSGTRLRHVSVKNAAKGLYVYNTGIHVSKTSFINNQIGIEIRSVNNVVIDSSEFTTNNYGIYTEYESYDTDPTSSIQNTFVSNSNFADNNIGAYFFLNQRDFKNLNLTSNVFSRNQTGLTFSGGGYGCRVFSTLISKNVFIDNTLYGLDVGQIYGEGAGAGLPAYPLIVEKNTFVGNGVSWNYGGGITGVAVKFSNNIISSPKSIALSIRGQTSKSDLFSGNLLFSNVNAITIQGLFSNSYIASNKTFTNNTFVGSSSSPMIRTRGTGMRYSFNNFNYYSKQVLLSVEDVNNVDANDNFWGTLDREVIGEMINDKNENFELGVGSFTTILNQKNTTSPISFVSNAQKKLTGSGLIIEWSPNTESDISGYKIYYGGFNGYSYTNVIDVGNVTSFTMPADVGINEDIGVTAYDVNADGTDDQVDGNESWYSPANQKPAVPDNFSADGGPKSARLSWNSVANASNYYIYRSTDSVNFTKVGNAVGTNYIDTALTAGLRYHYKITAFDSIDLSYSGYGLESDFTDVQTIKPSRIFYVNASTGNNTNYGSLAFPFRTIQAAIDASSNADTVILARGTYLETIDLKGKIAFLASNYYLTGDTADIYRTVLSGKNNGNTNLIENTLNCFTSHNRFHISGFTIEDVRLRAANISTGNCANSLYTLSHSVIRNSGSFGEWGVIAIGNSGVVDSCTFYGNKGRYILSTTNHRVDGSPVPVITNSRFYDNASSADGSLRDDVSVIHVERKTYVTNNLVYRNLTTGIDFGGNGSDSMIFVNNTVALNRGYGMRFQTWGGSYSGILINNVSAFNRQSDLSANTVTAGPSYYVRHNLFGKQGRMNETNLFSVNNTLLDTTGNIGGDPFFVDTANNDYRLLSHSPAIGAGASTNYLPAKDIDGNIRINPWRTVPDLGAFESTFKFSAPIITKTEPGNKQVKLFWTQKGQGNITGYNIYRDVSTISDTYSGAAIATINGGSTLSFVDSSTQLENGVKYYYRLQSVYTDNTTSGLGRQATGVPNLIAVPTNFQLDNSPKFARITWDSVRGNQIKYQLFRDQDSTNQTMLADSIATNSYLDTTFNRNTVYYYRIRTIDSAGALSVFSPAIVLRPLQSWYVDAVNGHDDRNIGSARSPFATISKPIPFTVNQDSILIEKGTYTDNIIVANKKLFFIGLHGPTLTLLRPRIQSNIFYLDNTDSTLIKGLTLFNASERVAGSAILEKTSVPILEDIIFRNSGASGGIINTMGGSFIMNNCVAYDNNPNTFFELSNSVSSTAIVNHFTYTNNTGHLFSSGLPTYKVKFRNSIIWSNSTIPYTGVIEVENSIFKGGFPTGINVLDTLPYFVNTAAKNFKLLNYSPAVGLGDSDVRIPKDIEGIERPSPAGSKPDAGAYELEFGHASPLLLGHSALLGNVRLQWRQYPLSTVDKIYIYKGYDSTNLTKYDSAAVNQNYRDSLNTDFNKVMFYKLSSIGAGLRESGLSNIVRTIAFTSPVLEDNILGPQDSSVLLKWNRVNNALTYKIQLSLDSNFVQRDTTVTSDSSYTFNGLLTNSTYYWRAQTMDSLHTSDWSVKRSFRTRLKQPIITSIKAGNKVDTVFWSANKNINVKRYNIYRDTVINPTTLLDSVAGSVLSYIDTIGLKLKVRYYYRVAAVDSSDLVGPFSASDSATPFNRPPVAVRLEDKSFNNAGKFNTVRTVYSALGSADSDGKIVSYKWYVNDSLINSKDSVFIHYYVQGLNKLRLEVKDNDDSVSVSEASITITSFVKTFAGGFLGGIAALDKNNLYIADSSYDPIRGASVYKLDANGNTVFPLIVTSKIFTTPSIASDSSLFITNGSSINGFNFNGAPLWPTISLGGLTYVTPTIDSLQNRLYIGVSNSNFFAIDYKTGRVVWNLLCDAAINSSAVITGDRKLVFASNLGTLYGFDLTAPINASNPEPKWKRTFSDKFVNTPAVDSENHIYIGTEGGKLQKLKLEANGSITQVWTAALDAAAKSSPVIDAQGDVYIGTTGGKFYKIKKSDGTVLWSYASRGPILSTPAISDFGSIYVADSSGLISSLNTDGTVNWTHLESSPITANILYIDNTIYLGTKSGKFVGLYDNPATNTVNTLLGKADQPAIKHRGSLANMDISEKAEKLDNAYDELFSPQPNLNLTIAEPVWGTFQGNAKRTGSRSIICPDRPILRIANCTNYADSFMVSTSDMVNKSWVINDQILNSYRDTFIYVKPKDSYKLMASNDLGCTVFSAAPVYLNDADLRKPSITTSTGNNRFCSNDSITLSSSVTADKYQWFFKGTAIADASSKTLTTSIQGAYSVMLSNKFGCTVSSDVILLQSQNVPTTPSVSNASVCIGGTLSALSATASAGNSLRWYGTSATGGTASSTAPIATSNTVGTTNYYVSQVNANGCESDRATIVFTVNDKPATPSVSNASICIGGTVSALSATASAGNSLRWYGTSATGGTASSTAPIATSNTVGTTNYYVSQVNANGCESDRATIVFTVNDKPAAPSVSNASVCIGGTAPALNATALAGNSLRWYGTNASGGTASSTAPTPTSNTVGTTNYFVSQVNANGCESDRAMISFTVNDKPLVPAIAWNGVELSVTNTFASYQWLLNNNAVIGAISNLHKPLNPGAYRVRVTNASGCSDTSVIFNIVMTAVVAPTLDGKQIQIYPNPVQHSAFIDLGQTPQKPVNVQLITLDGRRLAQWVVTQRRQELPLGNIQNGTYLIQVQNGKRTATLKIIKQ